MVEILNIKILVRKLRNSFDSDPIEACSATHDSSHQHHDEMENSFVYCQNVLVKIHHKIINLIILVGMADLVSLSHISSH